MTQNCVVYLIRSIERSANSFMSSLRHLEKNFLPWSPADVIVFHECDLDVQRLVRRLLERNQINARDDGSLWLVIEGSAALECRLRFEQVDFSAVPAGAESLSPKDLGYRHMCHFFANDVFLRDELAPYRYFMRHDDDSYIKSPLRFNVFDEMRNRGYKYGYRAIMKDKPHVCKGLWPCAQKHFAATGSVRDFKSIRELGMYYTNFEICDLDWFRGDAWQGFFKSIDQAGGIWRHRWGDAPIRYLGVQGLLRDAEIRQFVEMHYFHQAVWRSGHARRLPWDLAKFYWLMAKCLVGQRFRRS